MNFRHLRNPQNRKRLFVKNGKLVSGKKKYPIINNIPRFTGQSNYANNFGFQWNKFFKTQLDSYTGFPHSEERLARCLNGHLKKISGKKVLEVGCGAGRFSEILLKYGANLTAIDYSSAVDANKKNNGKNKNITILQADLLKMPFNKSSFDYVICLGVLQHTPSPENSIKALWSMVKKNGFLIIDHYLWKLQLVLPPPVGEAGVLYRYFVLRMPEKKRYKLIEKITKFWFPIHWKTRKNKIIQKILARLSPVHFYYQALKLKNKKAYFDWALLDTHDALTDVYKHHRTCYSIKQTLKKLFARDIIVKKNGNGIEAFCKK